MNGRSLSRSILPPPGRPVTAADGGLDVDLIEILAETYGKGLLTDGRKAQSFQSTTRAEWRAFSLAVLNIVISWLLVADRVLAGISRATISA
jgi:hypothetical protein